MTGIFYGWRMMAAAAVLRILGSGLHHYGFTIFFLPLSRDLELSRTATSFAFSLARAEGAIEGPLVGYLLDRFGPRPIMMVAVILTGTGYLLLSTVDSYASFLFVYTGMISLAYSGGFMHSPVVLANTWFVRQRARAMTSISAAFGVGGALISPLLAVIVHAWGWRWGALTAGLLFLIIGLPLCWTIRRSPESMGYLPDGDPPALPQHKSGSEHRAGLETDWTVGRAMRSMIFWSLVAGTAVRAACYNAISSHFIPILVWKGLSEQEAALFLGTFAFLSIVATLGLGWFADKTNKPRMVMLIMFLTSGTMLLLIFSSSLLSLWLFLILLTLVEPTYPVGWAIVGDFFGRKHFAKIRGNMTLFYMWGGVVGPVLAGAIYDRWESYEPLLWTLAVLFLVPGLSYGMLVKPWKKIRAAE
ncbi:MAG: MFS transporter [Candidatus Binatia bacterium]